jgi:hypothetical protein
VTHAGREFNDPSIERMGEWDESLAQSLIGKTVLIGITVVEHDGTLVEQFQLFGTITHVDQKNGIAVWLKGTNPPDWHILPPAPFCVVPAERGVYRLRSTGEEIENPDYVSTWTSTRPPPGDPSSDA